MIPSVGAVALTSVVKQVQVLSLFSLIDNSIDDDVKNLIKGQQFALLNYNFYSSDSDSNSKRQLIGYLADDQEDKDTRELNFSSTSAFVNVLVILIMFAVLIIVHIILA